MLLARRNRRPGTVFDWRRELPLVAVRWADRQMWSTRDGDGWQGGQEINAGIGSAEEQPVTHVLGVLEPD